jgi:hypothetical protein
MWFAVAAFALVFAVVALYYGGVDRSSVFAARFSTPDTMTTGSVRPAVATVSGDDTVFDGGRSDIAATPRPSDGAASLADVSRLKVENVALRQSVDQLRGQIDRLTERLGEVESRLVEMTGSISGNGQDKSSTFFDVPDVPPSATASATPPEAPAAAAPSTQFGIELGAFSDLNAVKTAWRRMLDEHGNLFSGLDALATVRDRMGRTELLLVAGPFKNAADASEHCGKVEAAGLICQPAFYLGQQLSIR